MRFLLLNQTFYPDVMASGQYLSDLAVALVQRGHQVTVLTGRRAYDEPQRRFAKEEIWRGVRILRVNSTGFGRGAKWRRATDFASFLLLSAWRLARLPRADTVVALTSPPLIAFLGARLARLRRCRFVYWVMDLNPDEAIAAGWLRHGSLAARFLERISRFSLREAARVIVLDRFMRDRIVAKGIPAEKIIVLPPWAHDGEIRFDRAGRDQFRREHGLQDKFVVMYSGNHSPCHPLDTVFEAARRLSAEQNIMFCFVGGGSEWRRLQQARANGDLSAPVSPAVLRAPSPNLLCLPYRRLDQLAGSLSAGDLHLVIMGEPLVGLVHPCKLYNLLAVAAPLLYIGPWPSHVTEVLGSMDGDYPYAVAAHGAIEQVVAAVLELRRRAALHPRVAPASALSWFSKQTLLSKLIAELET